MKRRDFLTAASAAAAAGTFRSAGQTAAGTAARPNILWIMTDQQCADSLSIAGNPDLSTPAMDSIAAAGVRFEKAYCTQPICVPSRTSMMTGKMPHETGVTFNLERMDLYDRSLGHVMTDAGYDTGYVGKWHIPEETSGDWHGFEFMIEGSHEFNDQYVAAPVIDFITRPRNKPFFAVASFVNPHDICEWARKLAHFGRGEELWNGIIPDAPPPGQCPELPSNFAIPENEPGIIRDHQTWLPGAYPVRGWSEDTWRQYRWGHCRLTELADREIGKILAALRSSGLDQNTIIILVSDHGDGNGAHQWNQKNLLYDEPARVPLIVAGPGVQKPGRTDEHLVSTGLDLFPTFCDYAGVPVSDDLRGLSLRPLVEGRSGPTHDAVVVETDLHRRYGQSGGVFGRMLRTPRYKYVAYSEGELREQLFDMQNDPGEMNNLAVEPAYRSVLAEHRQMLAAKLQETDDFFVVPGVDRDGWKLQSSAPVNLQ